MNLPKTLTIFAICFFGVLGQSQAQERFNKKTDLFIAQFDNLPDNDDVQSQAAVGSLLAHPDFKGVNYFCAAGAWGAQWTRKNGHRMKYIDSNELFELAFGSQAKPDSSETELAAARWVDAHGPYDDQRKPTQERIDNLDFAAEVIKNKAQPILEAGGRVWVMEAGQSDLSAKWVEKLIAAGVGNVKTNVFVVQHSTWNENATTKTALAYVKENANYTQIEDGNWTYGKVRGKPRGDQTPNYKNSSTSFMKKAIADSNPNEKPRLIWKKAKQITDNASYRGVISKGGVDFSDTVEAMWIFDLADKSNKLTTVADFWNKFVVEIDGSEAEQAKPQVGAGNNPVFNEVEGVVVIEAEHSKTNFGQWSGKKAVADFSGEGYLEFGGNKVAGGAVGSPLVYDFKINQAGVYYLHLRCARETQVLKGETRKDVANDCYVRVLGDYDAGPNPGKNSKDNAPLAVLKSDTKFFGGDHEKFVWASGSRLDLGHKDGPYGKGKRTAAYTFKANQTYRLIVSGRSKLFKLDRIGFRQSEVNTKAAQSLDKQESFVGQ